MNTVTEMSSTFDVTHEDLFTDVKKRFPGEYYFTTSLSILRAQKYFFVRPL